MKRQRKFDGKVFTYFSGHMKLGPAEEQKRRLKGKGHKVRIITVHRNRVPIFNVYVRRKRR